MTTYNFKRETKVYVVYSGIRYSIDVYSDLSYSQTFNETSVPVKTLHSQFDMFENAVVNRANPANFSFTAPVLYGGDLDILWNLLVDYDTSSSEATLKTADLYFESNSEVYKIEKCVFESGVFQLSNKAVMTMSLSGTGSKLSKFSGVIPGAPVARSSRNFGRITALTIAVAGVVQPRIVSLSVEVKNQVTWIDFATLQDSMLVSDASGTLFPGAFVVGSRTLSGNISQYVTDETNANVNKWAVGSSLLIQAGELGKAPILTINIPAVVYTNRLDTQEILTQSYDYRMISSSAALSSVIIKGA